MPEEEEATRSPRALWSGSIAFGLVSIPVNLVVATRTARASLRMVSEEGTPLTQRYLCTRDSCDRSDRPLAPDEIARGYEFEKGRFVVVTDDELESLAPDKSREIDLKRFVPLAEIDPMYFKRGYFLTPDRGGTKAYRLLAKTLEDAGRAGLATFVLRGKEHLAAIIADGGVLRAETLRFPDELRSPADIGLRELSQASATRVRAVARDLESIAADEPDREALSDRQSGRLLALVQRKLDDGRDVIHAPEAGAEEEAAEQDNVVDLMQVLRRSLEEASEPSEAAVESHTPAEASQQSQRRTEAHRARRAPRPSSRGREGRPSGHEPARKDTRTAHDPALASRSKQELYALAQELGISGRSGMTKDELVAAIERAQ